MSQIQYPALWYTSGTPINTGQRECAYERWLTTHAGKHGTGYRRQATAIPLATGAGVHQGVGLLGEWIRDWQAAHVGQDLGRLLGNVPDSVIAWSATEAAERYAAGARSRGLELTKTDLDAAAAVETLIREQMTLIEAQIWIYGLVRLPVMLAQARVVSVEHEETPVVDCTCGLGDWIGQAVDHAARQCSGIVVQDRADLVWELFDDSTLVVEELKTKAVPNYGWEQQWEHNGQLWLHMEAIGRRLGKPVSGAYVPVLFKGKRDRVDRDDKASPRIQQSPLVYGWFDPGEEPLRPSQWSARYKWYDDWGKGHTLPRTYTRTPIWDLNYPLPERAGATGPESRVARWVKGWIQPVQYPELIKVFGPFPKPATLAIEAQRALVVSERRWRADVEYLRSLQLYEPSDVSMVDGVLITVADVIERSWACTKFDGTPCMGKRFCHREPGWESVTQAGDYVIRTPHHTPEKVALTPTIESLGLQWTDEADDDGGGE